MVKIKRMMEKETDGTHRQFFPQTHVSAVIGLEELGFSNGNISPETATKTYVGAACKQVLDDAKKYADSVAGNGSVPFEMPIATATTVGAISIGSGLTVDVYGRASLLKEFTNDFTDAEKSKLEGLKNYTAGANVSISDNGVISATGGSETGGVNQEYVDQKCTDTLLSAQSFTYSKSEIDAKISESNGSGYDFEFEKIGVVE